MKITDVRIERFRYRTKSVSDSEGHQHPNLNSICDKMDEEGYVHLPQKPGLGLDINFDYIEANRI